MTLPAGVVIPPTQPTAPTPTVLPPTMPAVSAPAHDMSYQPPAAPSVPAVAPPPASAQPAGAPVLSDPSLPPELQGKTTAEIVQYYNKLREFYLTHSQAAPAPAAPTAPAPTVPAAPAPSAPVAEPSAADFWADPVGAIKRVVASTMAPVTQTALQQQVVAARNSVLQQPGYGELEARVLAKLEGIPAEQLVNPALWQSAYYMSYGEAAAQGWRPSGQAPTPTPAAPTTLAVNTNPVPFAPTQFFSEPARPNAGPAAALTPEQQAMAAKLGVSHEDYLKWMPKSGGAQ